MKPKKMDTAPKDGTHIILFMEEVWIEGHWDVKHKRWYVVNVNSHGCGCCASDDEEPTAWIDLPIIN